MPFTPSHAAAILPLRRLGLPLPALAIGSMVPDLPYYLPVTIDSGFTHRLTGVLTLDLVLGLVCVAVWHGVLAPAAVRVAPDAVRRRLGDAPPQPFRISVRAVAAAACAVVLGAITHVVWDSFTHQGRFGPRHIGWLAQRHGALDGYRWAQYGSGLFGALVIGWALVGWWRAAPRTTAPEPPAHSAGLPPALSRAARRGVAGLLAGSLVAGAVAGWFAGERSGQGLRHTVFLVATTSGGTAAAVTLLAAVALRWMLGSDPAHGSEPGTR